MKRREEEDEIALGFPWYEESQWARLRELSADVDKLEDTFREWREHAERVLAKLRTQGKQVALVPVDVEAMAAWCREQGLAMDGAARSRYVAERLRELDPAATVVAARRVSVPADPYAPCPCGSGKKFRFCCRTRMN